MKAERLTKDLMMVDVPASFGTAKAPVERLLKQWLKMLRRYTETDDYEHNCWWFNERATLSTLAGAAWSMPGWLALEEFSTEKMAQQIAGGAKVEDEAPTSKRGRCDLYVASSDGTELAFEAKQVWTPLGKHAQSWVSKGMNRAIEDAHKLSKDEARHRFGAAFIVPSFPVKEVLDSPQKLSEARVREKIEGWLAGTTFRSECKGTPAIAYYFPRSTKHFIGSNKRIFPGVMLTLERVVDARKKA